jgi:acetyl esterase/lipase
LDNHALLPPVGFKADEQVIYKISEGRELSLYVYQPRGWSAGGKRAAFVYLHGGGWAGGTLHQGMDLLATVRDHGMVGINVEYRLADAQNLDPGRCIEDSKSALRFIRSKAQLLGIDPERIAMGGHSAGGHLAAACALLPTFNAASDDLQYSCKPNALTLIVPVLDNSPLEGFQLRARNGPWQWAQAWIVGQTVAVQSEHVPEPFSVRYAWSDFGFFNLFNEAGLPAPPFSSETLPAQQPAPPPAR